MPDIRLVEAAAAADDIFVTYGRVGPADLPLPEEEYDRALKPTIDTAPKEFFERDVVYEDQRQHGDYVLSGPIIGGWGPGRYFQNRRQALEFYRAKFGPRCLRMDNQTRGRWSVLIKKGENAA